MSRLASSFRSFSDLWTHRLASTPDTEAFLLPSEGRWRPIRWDEAHHTVARWGGALRAAGVEREDRVALLLPTSAEAFLASAAALGVGAVLVALDPLSPVDLLAAQLRAAGATVVWTDDAGAAKLAGVAGIRVVRASDGAEALPPADLAPSQLATLQVVEDSGRLASHTHEAWVAAAEAIEAARLIRPTDVVLSCLPMAAPLVRVLTFALVRCGVPTAAVPDLAPGLPALAALEPSVIVGGPRTFEALADEVRASLADESPARRRLSRWAIQGAHWREARAQRLPQVLREPWSRAERLALRGVRARLGARLRVGICVGGPLAPGVAELFHAVGVPVLRVWGPAEAGGLSCATPRERPVLGGIGPALPGSQVRIGAGGEILVEAAWMMRGYWGQPAETASAWSAGGLFRTGEAGELSSGALVLRGPLVAGPGGTGTLVPELEGRLRAACPWAEDVVLVGGGALVALLTPRPAELVAWANARGVPFTALADLVRRPEVEDLAWRAIEPLIRELPPHERVRRVAVVAEPFARENGLRGASGRVLRQAVTWRYQGLVDELRAGPERVFTFH